MAEPAWSPAPPQPFPPASAQAPPLPGYAQRTAGHQPPQRAPEQTAAHPMAPPPLNNGYGYAPHPQAETDEAWRRADFQPSGGHPPQRAPDPSAYDMGSYALPGNPPTGRDQRSAPAYEPAPQWAPQQADPYGYQGQAQYGGPQHSGYGADYGHPHQQPGANLPVEQNGYENEEVEYEEPPRRSRRWMIAAALVGSIGLGGGMAYGYKYFLAPKGGDKTQVVRAPREPARVAPTERGGKQFASTDSKLMNRLPPEGASNASGGGTLPGNAGELDASGVRRVQTVPVGRDMAPLPPPGTTGQSAVPGMTIVSGANLPVPGAPPAGPPAGFDRVRDSAPVQQSSMPSPQRVAAAPITQAPPAPPPRQPAPVAKAPPSEPVAPRPPSTKLASAPPAATPAPDRPKPTGYVAVLGYQRSQLEAMKTMADLQQKYEALRDRKLEIIQSDESSRGLGVIYRIVVGPRGGIAAAREVCTQLQQAGMPPKGCYTLAN